MAMIQPPGVMFHGFAQLPRGDAEGSHRDVPLLVVQLMWSPGVQGFAGTPRGCSLGAQVAHPSCPNAG